MKGSVGRTSSSVRDPDLQGTESPNPRRVVHEIDPFDFALSRSENKRMIGLLGAYGFSLKAVLCLSHRFTVNSAQFDPVLPQR